MPRWTPIFAIDNGYVVEPAREFYPKTWQLAIRHKVGIVRYCEIEGEALIKTYKIHDEIKAGEVIAHVGKMYRDSMLHFEFYTCKAAGPFTVRSNAGFQRRSDLADPAPLLDRLASDVRSAVGPEAGAAAQMHATLGRAPA